MPDPGSWLRFERRDRGTALVDRNAELPLAIQRPLRGPSGQAIVVLLSPAGALFDGDAVRLSVECGPGCDVTLTTAAATRLNRCERGEIVFDLGATVSPGATFRYIPHELIPFREARYRQRLALALHGDARALLLDVVTPGCSRDPFAYTRLDFETEVRRDGTLAVRERFGLGGGIAARLHGHTHYGSLLLLSGDDDARAAAADAADRLAVTGACAGASALPTAGIGLKMLGHAALPVGQTLLRAAGCPPWLSSLLPV